MASNTVMLTVHRRCNCNTRCCKNYFKKSTKCLESKSLTTNKDSTLEVIKKELYFCTNEYFYGKSRPYVQAFVCQHPKYQWPKCFDLKHDPSIYLDMPAEL